MNVNFEQYVLAICKIVERGMLGGSVIVAIDLGIFQELIAIKSMEKFEFVDVIVRFAILIAGAIVVVVFGPSTRGRRLEDTSRPGR